MGSRTCSQPTCTTMSRFEDGKLPIVRASDIIPVTVMLKSASNALSSGSVTETFQQAKAATQSETSFFSKKCLFFNYRLSIPTTPSVSPSPQRAQHMHSYHIYIVLFGSCHSSRDRSHSSAQPANQPKLILKEKKKQKRRPACSVSPCRVVALKNKRPRNGLWIQKPSEQKPKCRGKRKECDRGQAARGKAKLSTRRCVRRRRKTESNERGGKSKIAQVAQIPARLLKRVSHFCVWSWV